MAQMERKQFEQLETRDYVLSPQEMTSLHHAFSHPRYKDDPASVRKRELLEAWMCDCGLELPTDEPDITLPPPLTEDDSAKEASSAITLQSAMQNQDALFAMPQLQVCDVLTTCIEGIEVRVIFVVLVSYCTYILTNNYPCNFAHVHTE